MSSSLQCSSHQSEKHLMHSPIMSYWGSFMKMHDSGRALHKLLDLAPFCHFRNRMILVEKIHLLKRMSGNRKGMADRKRELYRKIGCVSCCHFPRNLARASHYSILYMLMGFLGYLTIFCLFSSCLFSSCLFSSECLGSFSLFRNGMILYEIINLLKRIRKKWKVW